jgi:hypothetical protein
MRRGLVYMRMRKLVRTRIRIRIPVMHLAPTHDMHDASHPHFVLDIPPRNVLLFMLVWVRDRWCAVSMAVIFLRQAYNHHNVLRVAVHP